MNEIVIAFFEIYQQGLNATNYRHEGFKINYDIDGLVKSVNVEGGLINALCKYSNITSSPQLLMSFVFFPKPEDSQLYFIFGSSLSGYDYAVRKSDGSVCIVDVDSSKYFFSVAKDEMSFVQVLTKLIEFEMYFVERRKMTPDVSSKFRRECIELAGGDSYSKLYRFIVISQGDQPKEKFILP